MTLRAGTCTAARPDWLVDQQNRARIGELIERLIERHRPIALALGDGEQPRLGAGAGMGVDRLPVGDDEALGRQRLQPGIVGAGRDRALDPRRRATARTASKSTFCRSMVSASRRLRKVVIGGSSSLMPLASISFSPVASSKRLSEQPSTLPRDEQEIELAQRIAGIVAFEIVLGAEQALPAGLALAAW